MTEYPNCLNPIEFGDAITARCEKVLKRYEDWNATVRNLHDQNTHLYLREIKIHEPPPSERRTSRHVRTIDRPIDPLPIAFDQVNHDYKYEFAVIPPPESVQFQQTHTIPHYREIQSQRQNDKTLPVNTMRLHGMDAVSAHVNAIPNTSSKVGPPSSARLRKIRLRNKAFETAQSSRGDRPLPVPRDLRTMGYESPQRERPFPSMQAITEHRETKKKIEKLELAMRESLMASAKHLKRLNRRRQWASRGRETEDLQYVRTLSARRQKY